MLTAEQRRENCDSRPRVKIINKGSSSPEVTPIFRGLTTSISETPYYQALERLAKSASEWMTLKKALAQEQGAEALKTLTYGNQILAASLRSNLISGTLRFRADIPKLTNSKSQSKQSSSKQAAQKRAKRPRVQDSTTTSEHHLTPLCPEPKKLTAILKTADPTKKNLPKIDRRKI